MNTSGERVSEMLMTLPAILDTDELRDVFGGAFFDGVIEAGRPYRDDLEAVVHGSMHPRDYDQEGMRAWLHEAWAIENDVKAVKQAVAEGSTAQEGLLMLRIGVWSREEGLSPDEAAEEMSRIVNADEPLPWER